MAEATRSVIILEKPSDWDEWLYLVKAKARTGRVPSLIDPDLPTEPPQPKEPPVPQFSDVKEGAETWMTLSREERESYRLLRDCYKFDTIVYEKKQMALGEVKSFIHSNISRQLMSFIYGKDSPYELLTALKKRMAPTDRARSHESICQYQELKKPPRAQQSDK